MAIELATGYVSVTASAKGFERDLRNETDGASRRAGDAAGDNFSDAFGGHLKRLAVIATAAFASLRVGEFLKGTISAASDLNESVSKVGVVFGDSAGEIQDWAKTAASSMGQSRQQALEAAGTFGNLFVALKIGAPQAAEMSKKMVGLAGDLASFNNVSPEEALEALRSGLVGETEPLRKFGVNLNDATLKAKAMELGLDDGKGVLDANAKAQAAYALILEQTGTAQGDFIRTSAGLANQQRIMSAQWIDLKASIGTAFLPVAAEAAKVVTTQLLPAFKNFADTTGPKIGAAVADVVQKLGEVPGAVEAMIAAFKSGGDDITSAGLAGKFEEIGLKLRGIVDFVEQHRGIFDPLIAGIGGLAGALVALKAGATGVSLLSSGMSALGAILPLVATPAGAVAVSIGLLAAAAVVAYQKIPLFREAVDSVRDAFKAGGFKAAVDQAGTEFGRLWDVVKPKIEEFINKIGPWLKEHGPGILEGLGTAFSGFATFVATEAFPLILSGLGTLLNQFGGWISGTAAPWLKDKFTNEWGPAFWTWIQDTAIPALLEKLPVVIDSIIAWLRDNTPKLQAAWKVAADAFWDWIERDALPQLKEKLPVIIEALTQFAAENIPRWGQQLGVLALDAIGRLGLLLLDAVGRFVIELPPKLVELGLAMIGGLLQGLYNAMPGVVQFFLGLPGQILGWLGDLGSLLIGHGQALVQGLLNGLNNYVGQVATFFVNLPGQILGWIGDLLGLLFGHGSDVIQGLLNGMNGNVGNVTSFFANLPGNILSWLGSLGSLLVGAGGDLLRGLLNGINSIVGQVSSFFSNLPGNILGWLGSLGSLLTGAGGDVISGFINGITSWIPSIAGHISGIPGSITRALGDVGSLLYSAGASVVSGFVDGIRGAIGSAASAAASLASSVKNAAFSALGIGSPSKVFRGIGVNVGEGFVLGLNDTQGMVGGAVGSMFGNLAKLTGTPLGMTASVGVSAAAGAGVGRQLATLGAPTSRAGGTFGDINIYAETNASPQAISQELSWVMLTAGR